MIKAWNFDFWSIQGREGGDIEDQALVQATFDRNLARLTELETIGFEGVFFSEHHFLNALSPCPNLLIAAAAQTTKTLKLGVLGNVLAFHQPWRLAEEIAMLDYLTHGRLEIGTASGVPPEFMFVNIAQEDVRPMYSEILEFLDNARENKLVDHHGKYWDYDQLLSLPRRKKIDRRREWMTVYTSASAGIAAKRGAKIALGYQSVDQMAKVFDYYREQMAVEGNTVSADDMAIRRSVLVWDTDSEAADLHQETLEAAKRGMIKTFAPLAERLNKQGDAVPQGVAMSGVKDAQAVGQAPADGKKPIISPLDSGMVAMGDEFIHGSPQTVADRIIDQCRRTGAGNFAAYHPSTFSDAELDHHYALWAKIIPILKSADVLKSAA